MECPQTPWPTDEQFLLAFTQRIGQLRVPLCGTLDLTYRCNLRCVHCCLAPQEEQWARAQAEMTTEQVLAVMDQFISAGCLSLLISGGEPLLRPDFAEVYRHAKMGGVIVSVFTNGTLITDALLDLWTELPPKSVEITLYGATAPTYERITGVPGSYERCLSGVRRLVEGGIRVRLKTMLMSLNLHEFEAMERIAQSFGVGFRFDGGLFPRFNGGRSPLALRVPPSEVVAKDFAKPEAAQQWREHFALRENMPVSEMLYNCGAGLTNFYVDPFGKLHPCVMARVYEYDVLHGSFMDGWNSVIASMRQKKASPSYPCNRCEKRTLCSLCPSFALAEAGSEEARSEYLCAIGHLRYAAILGHTEGR